MSTSSTPSFPLLRLIRPHQWLKNVFVFAGLMFSHAWNKGPLVEQVLLAFLAFCCASSLVYILNDWRDRAADAQHPVKRHRPLASGAVTTQAALGLATGLGLLAGTVAVGIPPSRWLLLTGLFIALFLGFAKRKAETFHAPEQQRAVLEHYPPSLLDTYIAVTMTATVITYGLYATSIEALQQHGGRLVYTVPVVVFALLRYTYQVRRGRGEDVARDLLRDPWIVAAGLAWIGLFIATRFWR